MKTSIDRDFLLSVSPALVAVYPGGGFWGIGAREISQFFAERKFLVNVADMPEICSFVFPATTVMGNLTLFFARQSGVAVIKITISAHGQTFSCDVLSHHECARSVESVENEVAYAVKATTCCNLN